MAMLKLKKKKRNRKINKSRLNHAWKSQQKKKINLFPKDMAKKKNLRVTAF
jgi:hypothetical protein